MSFSQSSVYSGLSASTTNMRDSDTAGSSTGAGTNSGANEWIAADLGAAHSIQAVMLGGGNISGWGSVAAYLNGAKLQSSPDNATWTDVLTVSGVVNSNPKDKVFTFAPVSARYWRLQLGNYLSTSTFRFYE